MVRDVEALANGFAKLVVQSLPVESELRRGAEYLEQLGTRLAEFEQQNPSGVRIPAVFYPKDKIVPPRAGAPADQPTVVEAIPWQLYLINTGLTPPGQPLRPGGEWQLIDLTSTKRFVNTWAAAESDTLRLQHGEKVDPPVQLFTELNSKIRFPEGLLHFRMPSGQTYVHEMTEPWEWSDFLTAVGIALAAIAIVAAVIATGGAAAPAAVAFYAGLGGGRRRRVDPGRAARETSAGHPHQQGRGRGHGLDRDRPGRRPVSGAVTAGHVAGRGGPTGADRQPVHRAAAGGVGQQGRRAGWRRLPGLVVHQLLPHRLASPGGPARNDRGRARERKKMRGQLIRRALLTGALLAVALKGDVGDVQAGRTIRCRRVDPDGSLVLAPHADVSVTPGVHPATPHAGMAPHAQVTGPVHQAADRTGAVARIGPQTHGIGVAGEGRSARPLLLQRRLHHDRQPAATPSSTCCRVGIRSERSSRGC